VKARSPRVPARPGRRPALVITACLLAGVALAVGGCGEANEGVDALARDVGNARDAQALSSLQQALTAAALVRAEAGGTYGTGPADLVRRLHTRDPSKDFTTGLSGGPEQVQVVGGGADPLMLVARSPSGRYLAIWDNGGGATLYYEGDQPPTFTSQQPAAAGWSATPPS
jgi:hypothetical protein